MLLEMHKAKRGMSQMSETSELSISKPKQMRVNEKRCNKTWEKLHVCMKPMLSV